MLKSGVITGSTHCNRVKPQITTFSAAPNAAGIASYGSASGSSAARCNIIVILT